MVTTTVLTTQDYKVGNISDLNVREQNSSIFLSATLKYSSTYDQPKNLIISSTYGKYADKRYKLTQAVLYEHKIERERDDKKFKS
ncbi:MAG: hypothetical protein A2X26_07980 [Chloroflexi bacterium GWC2_49_37]|nr:MAG: hypothetical protein A2X26_07980 [Chloroflexi bacterium GWC2_49_37]